jgi:hypothetical protein
VCELQTKEGQGQRRMTNDKECANLIGSVMKVNRRATIVFGTQCDVATQALHHMSSLAAAQLPIASLGEHQHRSTMQIVTAQFSNGTQSLWS